MRATKKIKLEGFSLVEVLLAIVILGLVAAPILSSFIASYNTNNKAKELLAASDLAQGVVESCMNQPFKEAGFYSVTVSDPVDPSKNSTTKFSVEDNLKSTSAAIANHFPGMPEVTYCYNKVVAAEKEVAADPTDPTKPGLSASQIANNFMTASYNYLVGTPLNGRNVYTDGNHYAVSYIGSTYNGYELDFIVYFIKDPTIKGSVECYDVIVDVYPVEKVTTTDDDGNVVTNRTRFLSKIVSVNGAVQSVK